MANQFLDVAFDSSVDLAPDPSKAVAIANHPEVKPFVGVDDNPIEIGEHCRIYENEGRAFVYAQQEPGIWHLHTLSLPDARGRALLQSAKDAATSLFIETDCTWMATITPDDAPHAHPPKSFGFQKWFYRPYGFPRGDVGFTGYRLLVDDWIVRCKTFRTVGKAFHKWLESHKTEDVHPDDAHHDAFAGFAALAATRGQIGKALGVFNAWARCAGYTPIEQVSDNEFFTGDAVIRVHAGKLEMVKCL